MAPLIEPGANALIASDKDPRPCVVCGQLTTHRYILSALRGLVRPTMPLDPYELHIAELDRAQRLIWGRRVGDQLQEAEPDIFSSRVSVLAGQLYVTPLQDVFGDVLELPLSGLGIGQRLAWFKRELANR